MAQTLVGLFRRREDAHQAIQALMDAGFAAADIGFLAPEDASRDIAAGAEAGAAVGGATGFLLTVVAFAIPGAGPVLAAGTLAGIGALTGAGMGVIAGGLLGALVQHGVPEELAPHFATGLKRGDCVVSVHASEGREAIVSAVFQNQNAAEVEAAGLSTEALRRGHAELAHLTPVSTEARDEGRHQ